MNPTATIYQNETEVVVIFSPVKDDIIPIRGASILFENRWSDGACSGLSCEKTISKQERYLIDNNFIKRGTVELGVFCYAKHTLKNGSTLTCGLNVNHSGEHKSGKITWA